MEIIILELQKVKQQWNQWSTQASASDAVIRELQSREIDFTEALNAKDTQLAVFRVRLQETDNEIKTLKTKIQGLEKEHER